MCGIVGISAQRPIVRHLIEGLQALEYRGYDSAGIAMLTPKGIERLRAKGKVKDLAALQKSSGLDGVSTALALEALGYTRSQLVGQRLLALIPPRYQQAHVAGFTRHVVNGRSPLLGQLVNVPVVVAGGAEVEAKVQIDRIGLVDGRSLFYAEFSF